MKTKLGIIFFLLAATLAHAQTNNLTALLQQGLFEEQANRNLDAAIADYQALARQFDKDRQLAATAVFRLGECYRMQGKTNEAALEYQRILRDFSDQQTLATLSRQDLTGMGMIKSEPAAIVNSDAALWNKLKDVAPAELERILPTLVPNAMLDYLLQQRNAAQAQSASLLANGFTTNSLLVEEKHRLLTELNRQIREEISGIMDGLKLRAELSPSPQTAGDARQQQRELLAKQIALAEQDLAETQKLVQVGTAPLAESRAAEREVLRLRQQLAALDAGNAELLDLSIPDASEEDQEIVRIQTIIRNSPDLINARVPGGEGTPLQKAAAAGWIRVATYLLDHGADVNADRGGALYAAAKAGNRAMVELLLSRGSDVNPKENTGQTPLHVAVQNGFQAVVEVLLANKADVNAQNGSGVTPLFLAAGRDNPRIVSVLLEHKADVNQPDQSGATPLINAAHSGHLEIAKLLLAAGANPNMETSSSEKNGPGQLPTSFYGRTALSFAAESGSPEMVRMLLAAKADPNGGKLNAPLLCAIYNNNIETAELLLQAGAKPDSIGEFNFARQPRSNGGFGGEFGGGGRPVSGRGGRGGFGGLPRSVTPLWLAISENQLPMVQLLLKFKADPNDLQTGGQPLLFNALSNTNILEALLDAGAKADVMDVSPNVTVGSNAVNWTPLGKAAWLNNAAAVEMLLKHGENPNIRDKIGHYTPLHWAANHLADRKVFELLLAYKADRNVRDINGQTPLDILKEKVKPDDLSTDSAGKRKAGELADLLRQHGALDVLPDWDRITVSRPSAKFSEVVFAKGTNDWNQFTLFEALAVHYGLVSADPRTHLPEQRFDPNSSMLDGCLQFPNLENVIIRRPSSTDGTWREIKVDVNAKLKSGDCSQDVRLEWGDQIELQETDHPISAKWPGLSSEDQAELRNCLKRRVQLTVKGQTTNIVLEAHGFGPTILYGAYGMIFAIPPQFSLAPALDNSGMIRASSDLSRVKVAREHDPITGKTREWTVDCSNPNSPPNFWLRDGDVIEVPGKP